MRDTLWAHWAIGFVVQDAFISILTAISSKGRLCKFPAGPGISRNRGVCWYSYNLPLPTAKLSDNRHPGHLLLQYSRWPASSDSILGYKAGDGTSGFVDDSRVMVSLSESIQFYLQYTNKIKARQLRWYLRVLLRSDAWIYQYFYHHQRIRENGIIKPDEYILERLPRGWWKFLGARVGQAWDMYQHFGTKVLRQQWFPARCGGLFRENYRSFWRAYFLLGKNRSFVYLAQSLLMQHITL